MDYMTELAAIASEHGGINYLPVLFSCPDFRLLPKSSINYAKNYPRLTDLVNLGFFAVFYRSLVFLFICCVTTNGSVKCFSQIVYERMKFLVGSMTFRRHGQVCGGLSPPSCNACQVYLKRAIPQISAALFVNPLLIKPFSYLSFSLHHSLYSSSL